ncbi:hypothetical protein RRG08_021725 [Elysia crispata]|uniref:Uncharacterized protein n=1 Tax=Elysia crispata TaxID=231223 RepID=A0AAE0ZXQ8_9GAST|nr:hypothetical protein RRG08_021725 [Elysia crispata]
MTVFVDLMQPYDKIWCCSLLLKLHTFRVNPHTLQRQKWPVQHLLEPLESAGAALAGKTQRRNVTEDQPAHIPERIERVGNMRNYVGSNLDATLFFL